MSMRMTYVLASRILPCWLRALRITPTRLLASAIGIGARYQVWKLCSTKREVGQDVVCGVVWAR